MGTVLIRLGGRRYQASLEELSLAIHRTASTESASVEWSSTVAVLDPWPHESAAVIFGHIGFLDRYTVTFGPDGFAVEPGLTFRDRFGE